MSTAEDKDIVVSVCANCGEEGDNINNICNKCKMVKYCNAACKKKHRSKHKKQCERRVAEKHDENLFKQPPPKEEDCPICFLLLPSFSKGRVYKTCCGKTICSGCLHAPVYDNQGNKVNNQKCPFCRTPSPTSDEDMIERRTRRMDMNDAHAISNMGCDYRDGKHGLRQDRTKALELWHRAAELGYFRAYTSIGIAYSNGNGVEVDKKKAKHYYELAAMGGDIRKAQSG